MCFLRFELSGVANYVLILVIQSHAVCTTVLYRLPLDRYGYDQYVIFYQGCLLYQLAYSQPNYEYLQHHLVKLLADLTALQQVIHLVLAQVDAVLQQLIHSLSLRLWTNQLSLEYPVLPNDSQTVMNH